MHMSARERQVSPPMMRSLERLLGAVEGLPAARVEIDAARRSAAVRVGARRVARIDLRGVLVHAPAGTTRRLQRLFPSARPTPRGIVFHLAEPQGSSEALEAIRRRVTMERLIWQSRVASP